MKTQRPDKENLEVLVKKLIEARRSNVASLRGEGKDIEAAEQVAHIKQLIEAVRETIDEERRSSGESSYSKTIS